MGGHLNTLRTLPYWKQGHGGEGFDELSASLEELRQEVACQRESEAERIQEQIGAMFSAWSESFAEQRDQQDGGYQAAATTTALTSKLQQLDKLGTKLEQSLESLSAHGRQIAFLQVSS